MFKSLGHYPWRDDYPNGMADLQALTRKIRQAGMIAGFHIQHPKASLNDPYVTPVPDHRLNLLRTFTLAASLDEKATTITVEESPDGCDLLTAVMDNKRQILKIGRSWSSTRSTPHSRPTSSPGASAGCSTLARRRTRWVTSSGCWISTGRPPCVSISGRASSGNMRSGSARSRKKPDSGSFPTTARKTCTLPGGSGFPCLSTRYTSACARRREPGHPGLGVLVRRQR